MSPANGNNSDDVCGINNDNYDHSHDKGAHADATYDAGDHSSGIPGNVWEFDGCPGKNPVREIVS